MRGRHGSQNKSKNGAVNVLERGRRVRESPRQHLWLIYLPLTLIALTSTGPTFSAVQALTPQSTPRSNPSPLANCPPPHAHPMAHTASNLPSPPTRSNTPHPPAPAFHSTRPARPLSTSRPLPKSPSLIPSTSPRALTLLKVASYRACMAVRARTRPRAVRAGGRIIAVGAFRHG